MGSTVQTAPEPTLVDEDVPHMVHIVETCRPSRALCGKKLSGPWAIGEGVDCVVCAAEARKRGWIC